MALATVEIQPAEIEGMLAGNADSTDSTGGPSLEAMEVAAAPVIRRLGKKFPAVAWRSISAMRADLDNLRARRAPGDALEKIFVEAHDMRGQAQTFGFGSLGQVANSLSEFILGSEEMAMKRGDLIKVHIDSMELCLHRETDSHFEGPEADELMAGLQEAVVTVLRSRS